MTRLDERFLPHFESVLPGAAKLLVNGDLRAKDPRIQRTLELLQQGHSITIAEIANKLNLSASRFRHLFKQELNIPPTYYLKLARLEQAKSLIESSFLRVKEVAASVGLNDVSHFVRDYKALYGQTPSQTRALSKSVPHRAPNSRRGQ